MLICGSERSRGLPWSSSSCPKKSGVPRVICILKVPWRSRAKSLLIAHAAKVWGGNPGLTTARGGLRGLHLENSCGQRPRSFAAKKTPTHTQRAGTGRQQTNKQLWQLATGNKQQAAKGEELRTENWAQRTEHRELRTENWAQANENPLSKYLTKRKIATFFFYLHI